MLGYCKLIYTMIKVILEGSHQNHYVDYGYEIHPLTSSVTLIQHAGKNILVDTGSYHFRDILLEQLKKEGLKPKDIHYILNTHYHLDHTSNNTCFPDNFMFISRATLDYKTGKCMIYKDLEKIPYPKGIKMIQTPGHSEEHVSYIYKENGKTYVMAGDAIREDVLRDKNIPSSIGKDSYKESVRKIFEIADVIIPGHGRVIEGKLLKELRELI